MKNINLFKILKIAPYLFVLVFGFFFFHVSSAEAACVVTSAQFRHTPQQINANTWYNDNNKPYVYIDFMTQGCIVPNNTFELSITESDTGSGSLSNALALIADDDVNGNDLADQGILGIFCSTSQAWCFDNRTITVVSGVPDFTLALRAGEDECESVVSSTDIHCNYYIRINNNVLGGAANVSSTSHLSYNCYSTCDENWDIADAWPSIINFGATASDDPVNNTGGGGGGNTGGATATLNEGELSINIQNPIGGGQPLTLVGFIEKIIKFVLTVGIPIVAIAIIYSGLLMVTARGNDAQLEKAKNAFTYSVIGGAILLGAWIFAGLIKQTIESIVMIITYFA